MYDFAPQSFQLLSSLFIEDISTVSKYIYFGLHVDPVIWRAHDAGFGLILLWCLYYETDSVMPE